MLKGNRTEFKFTHHFKLSECLFLSYIMELLFYSMQSFLSKSCPLLAANSRTSSYYLPKTEAVIVFWHEYYAL